jgi:hypothetical protein
MQAAVRPMVSVDRDPEAGQRPGSHRAQAERCRRLAASVMDRVIRQRLLEAAQIYDELAAKEEAPAGDPSASGR